MVPQRLVGGTSDPVSDHMGRDRPCVLGRRWAVHEVLSAQRLGAILGPSGTTFRVWTTKARNASVRLHGEPRTIALSSMGDGVFEVHLSDVGAGALYTFLLDGRELPDPYARFLPSGVHGP